MTPADEAAALIAALGLEPHPEGGHYRELYRDRPPDGGRGAVTTIYYLLRAGERSHWHRIDATEIWNYHAGASLALLVSEDGRRIARHRLGADVAGGAEPQVIVPPRAWQSAEPEGAWTLCGCVVAPAFEFAHFEMAPAGWKPG